MPQRIFMNGPLSRDDIIGIFELLKYFSIQLFY